MSVKRLREGISQEAANQIRLLLAREPKRGQRPPIAHPVGSHLRKLKPMGYPTSWLNRWNRRR
jgi:hypothetical protein